MTNDNKQPGQGGVGDAVAWLGCNPRTGVPAACAYKPSPTVMREFNMRPLIYADNAPPSAPVGVEETLEYFHRIDTDPALFNARFTQQPAQAAPGDGPHGFIHWLDEGYEIEWLREWRGGNCHVYLAATPPGDDAAGGRPAPQEAWKLAGGTGLGYAAHKMDESEKKS